MIRSCDQWFDYCYTTGTRGDMVFDILKDWQEEQGYLRSVLDELSETHAKLLQRVVDVIEPGTGK